MTEWQRMTDDERTAHMAGEQSSVILQDECQHTEICTWDNAMRDGTFFQCEACKKKIAIPMRTAINASASDMEHIMLIAFGARWANWYKIHALAQY